MTPAAAFIVLAAVVVVATALALAGRWRPEGLPDPAPREHDQTRFDVVVRGYAMAQVDAEIQRLHGLLEQSHGCEPEDRP